MWTTPPRPGRTTTSGKVSTTQQHPNRTMHEGSYLGLQKDRLMADRVFEGRRMAAGWTRWSERARRRSRRRMKGLDGSMVHRMVVWW